MTEKDLTGQNMLTETELGQVSGGAKQAMPSNPEPAQMKIPVTAMPYLDGMDADGKPETLQTGAIKR